jgi:hypothetical protein
MNAEPQEINAKADDDAHAASNQDGPRIGGPIILVGDRTGLGVHRVPPWPGSTTYVEALRVDSVNIICALVDTVNAVGIRSGYSSSKSTRERQYPTGQRCRAIAGDTCGNLLNLRFLRDAVVRDLNWGWADAWRVKCR